MKNQVGHEAGSIRFARSGGPAKAGTIAVSGWRPADSQPPTADGLSTAPILDTRKDFL